MAEDPEFDVEFFSHPDEIDRDGIKTPDYAIITAETFEALGLGVDRATEIWVEEGVSKHTIRMGGFESYPFGLTDVTVGGIHGFREDGKWKIIVLKNLAGACTCMLGVHGIEDQITDDGRCIGCSRVRVPKSEWEIMWDDHNAGSKERIDRMIRKRFQKKSERD